MNVKSILGLSCLAVSLMGCGSQRIAPTEQDLAGRQAAAQTAKAAEIQKVEKDPKLPDAIKSEVINKIQSRP